MYLLCRNDHYTRDEGKSYCPAKNCTAPRGVAVPKDEPDPRGHDPFFYGWSKQEEARAAETAANCTFPLVTETRNGATSGSAVKPLRGDQIADLGALGPLAEGYHYTCRDGHYSFHPKRVNKQRACLHVIDGAKCRRPCEVQRVSGGTEGARGAA